MSPYLFHPTIHLIEEMSFYREREWGSNGQWGAKTRIWRVVEFPHGAPGVYAETRPTYFTVIPPPLAFNCLSSNFGPYLTLSLSLCFVGPLLFSILSPYFNSNNNNHVCLIMRK